MRDYRSLEQIIRQVRLDEAEARNTTLRKKVENVGRPMDDNKDANTSKLAKQAEIKTKIIDEASLGHHNFEVEYEKKKYSGDPNTVKKTETYKVPKEFHGQTAGTHTGIMKRIKAHPESAAIHNKHVAAGFGVSEKPIKFTSTNESTVVEAVGQIQDLVKVDKKSSDSEKNPMKITGGKTEVDLAPTTNDAPENQNMEDQKSKKTTKEENKKIGAKGVKEETMTGKLTFGSSQSQINAVTEAMKMMKGVCPKCGKTSCQCAGDPKKMKEELVGNQKKLDKNHSGKLDKQDFEMLRKEEVSEAKLAMPLKGHSYHKKSHAELKYIQKDASEAAKANKGGSAEAKYLDQVNDASTVLHYRSKGGKQLTNEEVESIDELSSGTRSVYRAKAGEQAKGLRKQMGVIAQVKTDDPDVKSAIDTAKKDTKRKLNNRVSGMLRSTQKEEVEFSEAEIARIEEIARGL